jgi:spore coat polysaccharide biosynthesis predicted glycosyltransferase SpsG
LKPDVVLIADAGPGIGWGHAVRQLALAEALVAQRVRTLFVTRTRDALALDWPCPVRLVCDADLYSMSLEERPTKVNDLRWGGPMGGLLFDDYGNAPEKQMAVDPHFGAVLRRTAGFLGPRWAPLRAPFSVGHLASESRSGVFVYGDTPALPSSVVPVRHSGFDARKAAATMGRCAIALVPPSMVALECLAIGTPVVLYVPGPKWQPIADAMVAAGVAKLWSGRADDHTLGCVLADDGLRRRMSEAGREAVDGRGAERLAEWLA